MTDEAFHVKNLLSEL